MCIVSAKITELVGRLKWRQGDTLRVWYYVWNVVGSPHLPYNRSLADKAAGSNYRCPSSIRGRAEHLFVNSSKIVKFLWKTNDGRGGTPDWVVLNVTYAPAKTLEREGKLLLTQCFYGNCLWYLITVFISHHTAYMGNCYYHVSSLVYLVCCIGSGKWNATRVTLHEFDRNTFCEIREIFKNTFFEENLKTTASETCSNFTRTALFDNLHFWLKLVHIFSLFIIIYIFVCQFSLYYHWYCYTIRSSIIRSSCPVYNNCCMTRSSRPVVFCKKVVLKQNSQENTCAKDSFLMKLQTYKVYQKKTFRHKYFLVNSARSLITLFLKNPSDSCFRINTRSVYCPTTTFCFCKNDVTHIFRVSIFSA